MYSARSINGEFPDIDKVIPDVKEATMELCLDLDILVPLLERIRKFHGKQDRKKSRCFAGLPLSGSTTMLERPRGSMRKTI